MIVETEPADAGAPTIYDVARAAGVSIASVSRVLNGRRNPSPEIRDRVQRAASELGYVPDSAARALSVRLKEVVGVVMRQPLSAGSPIPAPAAPRASTQRLMFPMRGFRRHFPFVTPAVTWQVRHAPMFRECVAMSAFPQVGEGYLA